jgi:hypothetical protein
MAAHSSKAEALINSQVCNREIWETSHPNTSNHLDLAAPQVLHITQAMPALDKAAVHTIHQIPEPSIQMN